MRSLHRRTVDRAVGAGAALGVLIGTGLVYAGTAKSDIDFTTCPSGLTAVVDGTPTTCGFADNVRRAWFGQPGQTVLAYSPTTGYAYWMTCQSSYNRVSGYGSWGKLCTGGYGAMVVIL